jgi:hypothetical protein
MQVAELDIQHLKEKLLKRERELVSILAGFEDEARAAATSTSGTTVTGPPWKRIPG